MRGAKSCQTTPQTTSPQIHPVVAQALLYLRTLFEQDNAPAVLEGVDPFGDALFAGVVEFGGEVGFVDEDFHLGFVGAGADGEADAADDGVGGDGALGGGRFVAGHVEEDGIVADVEGDAGAAGEGFEGLDDGAVVGFEADDGDELVESGLGDEADAGEVGEFGDDLVQGGVGEIDLDGAFELALHPGFHGEDADGAGAADLGLDQLP